MIQLPRDFQDFIRLLNRHGVEYLVVGGYAVAIHGYVRYTGDIDFFIALNPDNAQKMVDVFHAFGFNMRELNQALFLDKGKIIRIGTEPMRLEVLNQIDGVEFSDCYKNRKELRSGGLHINFIGLAELVKNKRATGRGKDQIDAEELEKRNRQELAEKEDIE